jgi:hypothetical protein
MSVPTYVGYSNFQKSQIDSILGRLSTAETTIQNNKTTYNTQVSLFNDTNSVIYSLISINETDLQSQIVSLVTVDSLINSTLDSHIVGPYTTKTQQLTAEDTRLDNALSTHITDVYVPQVSLLNAEDSRLASLIASHVVVYDADVASLMSEDALLNSKLDSHLVVFNADILSLVNSDVAINADIVNKEAAVQVKIAELEANDASLNAADASLNVKLTSHIAVYVEMVQSLTDADSAIHSTIDSHLDIYDAKMSLLDSVDSQILSTLTSHVDVYDAQVSTLNDVDSALNLKIDSHIDVYDSKISELENVDSLLQSTLDNNSGLYADEVLSLQAVDSLLQSTINSNAAVFGSTVSVLQGVDSLMNFNFVDHVNDHTFKTGLLDATDSMINYNLGVHIGNYANRFNLLENANANLNADLVSHIGVYDAKMLLLDSKNVEEDSRLTVLESRVDLIEDDIGTRIQAEIDSRITIAAFESIESRLNDEDDALAASLATKIASAQQLITDTAQDSKINERVEIVTYDSKMSVLDFYNGSWEGRLRAIEEFARAMLATYTITKPDETQYNFSGLVQQLSIAPYPARATAKLTETSTGNLGLKFEFTDYGYNSLMNKYHVVVAAAGFAATQDVLKANLTATGSGGYYYNYIRGGTSAQTHASVFNGALIRLLNTSGETVFSYNITTTLLSSLSSASV